LEVVIITPIVFGLLSFVLFAGRTISSRQRVEQASRDAARAASLEPTAGRAIAAATQTATQSLADQTPACANLDVKVDITRFGPGGVVSADVSCTVTVSDLSGLPLPADRTITARSAQVIDTHTDRP